MQIFNSRLFIGQSYFLLGNDESQNFLTFQRINKTITTFSGLPNTISEWKFKRLRDEKMRLLLQQTKVFLQKFYQ